MRWVGYVLKETDTAGGGSSSRADGLPARESAISMTVELFVNGTLMRGLALHHNLDGADFVAACQTAPRYRLYSIADVHPGMFEVDSDGIAVHGELYSVPDTVLERVEAGEPPGLYRAPVQLSEAASSRVFSIHARWPRAPPRHPRIRRMAGVHRATF